MTQSTAQAVADARKAADYMNATAPGSPAAQQATRTYLETKRLAAMANATHDPNIARQAVQASQASVNHTNNVATGRSPNAYSPYNSNGNATSYFNSSYQTGKTPSPGAPRIEELNEQLAYYCSIADRVPNINAFGAGDYGGISQSLDMTPSFLSGLLTGIGKNFSTIAVYIGASFEELTTGESRSASRAISNIKANTEQRRSDSKYPEIFDFGVILGDLLPSVALDKGAGKAASATMTATVTLKNGTSLIFAADSASVLEAAIKIAAASGALATSSNLGNDLVNAIKGQDSSKKSGVPVPEKTKASNGLDYQSNPKHTPGQPGNRNNAGIEPQNSLDLFGDSIQSTNKPNQRYTYDESTGTLHRFFNDGNGTWHWSGSTNQGQNSLTGADVPNDIKKIFNLPKKGW